MRNSAAAQIGVSNDILNYKASLAPQVAYYLGRLGTVLKRWNRLGYPGVTDAVSLLDDMRIAGGIKGAAVMTMCPKMGPFTNTEQEAIQAAVDQAFADGEIDASHYLFAWLLMALGHLAFDRRNGAVADRLCPSRQRRQRRGPRRH